MSVQIKDLLLYATPIPNGGINLQIGPDWFLAGPLGEPFPVNYEGRIHAEIYYKDLADNYHTKTIDYPNGFNKSINITTGYSNIQTTGGKFLSNSSWGDYDIDTDNGSSVNVSEHLIPNTGSSPALTFWENLNDYELISETELKSAVDNDSLEKKPNQTLTESNECMTKDEIETSVYCKSLSMPGNELPRKIDIKDLDEAYIFVTATHSIGVAAMKIELYKDKNKTTPLAVSCSLTIYVDYYLQYQHNNLPITLDAGNSSQIRTTTSSGNITNIVINSITPYGCEHYKFKKG